MTDQEFIIEVRRHIIGIIRALIIRYSLTWRDFMPREEAKMISAQDSDKSTVTYPPVLEMWKRG